MKLILLALILGVSFNSFAEAKKETKKVEKEVKEATVIKDPREVWIFSYDEFEPLRDVQKEMYYKRMAAASQQSPLLKDMIELKSDLNIKKYIKDEAKWNAVEAKVNTYCSDLKNEKECEKIAIPRDDVLLEYRARR